MTKLRPGILRSFLLASMSLCLSGSVTAQVVRGEGMDTGMGGGNTIIGTVYDSSGQRVTRRIQVRLATPMRGERVGMTDDSGNFVFRGIPSGNYAVIIDKEKEYERFTQAMDIIQLQGSPGGTYSMNIRLKLKPGSDGKPAVLNSELAGVPKPALDLYTRAVESIKAGDRKTAIDQFKLAIVEHPQFMLAHNEMGVQYIRLNEFVMAEEAFRAALKIKPEAFDPQVNLGVALYLQKRYADSEPVLRTAVKMKEPSAGAHYYLGMALANLGRFDEAEKELLSSVKLGGEDMKEAHRTLAIIYTVRKDNKRALAELETYVKLAPKAPDIEQLKQRITQLKGQ